MSVQFTDLPVVGVLDQNAIIAIVQDDTSYQTTLQKLLDGTEREINKGTPDGYAGLDKDSLLSLDNIPDFDADKITSGIFDESLIPNLTLAKIPDGLITVEKINAGGTRDNTTFLRGDGTWITVQSGGASNFDELTGTIALNQIPNGLITLEKLNATGTKDATTFLRGDNTFTEIPAGGIGANVMLSNLGVTAITEHLNFAVNLGLQTPGFQILQQLDNLFIQTKNTDTRLFLTRDNIELDPNVATLFYNKRMGQVRIPLADDEAANKKYVDDGISAIPTGANLTLSNLTDPIALSQDLTFNKLSPSIYFRAIDSGLHFNSYSMIESGVDLRLFENTNNEHGIIITPQTLQLVSSDGVDINNEKLLNLATPTNDTDAATKKYVDDNSGTGGANIELSNLNPNTLINQDLTFSDSSKGIVLQNGAKIWMAIPRSIRMQSPDGATNITMSNNGIVISASAAINLANNTFRNVINPVFGQDVATKNYVDTFSIALTQIPDNLITLAKLNTSGVKNNTTFLRGDGTFAIPQSGGVAGANTELSNLGVTAINTHLNLTGTNRLNFANAGSIRPENNTNALGIYAGNTLTSLFDDNGIISYVPINMGANKITALGTPTANDDAATKLYVDEHSGGTVNFDELEGTLANTQIPELEINLSKLNATGSDGGLMFVSSDGTISQIGNNATINQILVWAGGGWQPRDQPVIPTPIIYADRNLSNLTDPVSFNQHLIFSVDEGEITFKNGSQVSSSGHPRVFGAGIQILSPSGLNGLIITDTAIGFELLSENRKEIHFGNLKLMNALDPTADQDVATKHYVDNHAGVGGATTALSNLTTTAINEELIFDDATKGITFNLGGRISHTTGGMKLEGDDGGGGKSVITLAPTFVTINALQGLDMSTKKIRNLATPTDGTDATTKAYVDEIDGGANTTLSNLGTTALNTHLNFAIPQGQINFLDGSSIRGNTLGILIQGSQDDNHSFIFLNDLEFNFHSATDDFNFNSAKLSNVLDPTDNQQAATKHYVDTHAGIGGANQELSNLDPNTLINQDLTFAKVGASIIFSDGSRINNSSSGISLHTVGNSSQIILSPFIVSFTSADSRFRFNNARLTDLLDPTSLQDAATKNYVDSEITGIDLGFSDLSGTIGLDQIPNQAITESKYQNNSISTEKLQNLSITGAKIAVKSININKLSVSSGESLDKGICLYNLAETDFTLGGLQDVSGKLLAGQIDQSGATDGQVLKWSDASSAYTPQDP